MKIRDYPTQERLRELFDYSDESYVLCGKTFAGGLRVRKRVDRLGRANVRYAGAFAGTVRTGDGRVQLAVDGKIYELNRLIWVWHFGAISQGLIVDHTDRDIFNNRIDNYRLGTVSQNNCNRKKGLGCSSTHKGVYLNTRGKWCAQIKINGKVTYLGVYEGEDEAARARNRALVLHGDFAVMNEVE